MSEFDQGSGRKGFVRDVMRRIAPGDEQGAATPRKTSAREDPRAPFRTKSKICTTR